MKPIKLFLIMLLIVSNCSLSYAAETPESENPSEGWVLYDDFESVCEDNDLGINLEKWGSYIWAPGFIRVHNGFCEINNPGNYWIGLTISTNQKIIALKFEMTMAGSVGENILTGLICVRGVDNKTKLWSSISYWITDSGEASPWLTVYGTQPEYFCFIAHKRDYDNTILSPVTSATPFELPPGSSCIVTADFSSNERYIFGVEGFEPLFWEDPNQSDLPNPYGDLLMIFIAPRSEEDLGNNAATVYIDNVYVKYADNPNSNQAK